MLVHRRVTPSIKFAGTHLYTWVERGTVKVKCLAQEQQTVCGVVASNLCFHEVFEVEINFYLIDRSVSC